MMSMGAHGVPFGQMGMMGMGGPMMGHPMMGNGPPMMRLGMGMGGPMGMGMQVHTLSFTADIHSVSSL